LDSEFESFLALTIRSHGESGPYWLCLRRNVRRFKWKWVFKNGDFSEKQCPHTECKMLSSSRLKGTCIVVIPTYYIFFLKTVNVCGL